MKILIVDDSKTMRTMIRRTLHEAGFDHHEVSEACNGKEGLNFIQQNPVDLVLSDWNMPEMGGFEFLQTLRKEGRHLLFGFITSECTPEVESKALEAGALFVIAKPFETKDFTLALGSLLSLP